MSRDQVEERGMFFCSNCGHTPLVHVPDTDRPHEGCATCGFNEWIFEPPETVLAAKNKA
ncbi:hypothetical protein [Alicyclobacillus sp. SO9]|uniref:hypothetical protein n=1 Tax=Alicyclobacillus sp. SO9 TaxID=2665646 RepID=UPI0018E824CB|nr:hypothetical protein [Alicyclobacillus sp. SO9]QQE79638.1 hypothetical protein GI364_03865 [Alicyclobacillus sp. SO9]